MSTMLEPSQYRPGRMVRSEDGDNLVIHDEITAGSGAAYLVVSDTDSEFAALLPRAVLQEAATKWEAVDEEEAQTIRENVTDGTDGTDDDEDDQSSEKEE